jgi:hypothetical protein
VIVRVPGIYAADRFPRAIRGSEQAGKPEDAYTNFIIHADDLHAFCWPRLREGGRGGPTMRQTDPG